MSTKSNFDIQFDIHNEFSDRFKVLHPIGFHYKKITYEYVFTSSNKGNKTMLFRHADNPTCFIDFNFDYMPIFTDNNDFVRYKNFIYVNYFQCSNEYSTKGDGLKLLVAFANFIHNQVNAFNAEKRVHNHAFHFEIESIQLTAEPYNPKYPELPCCSKDYQKLRSYYKKLGFYFVNPEDKHNASEPALMEADFDTFYWKYRVARK